MPGKKQARSADLRTRHSYHRTHYVTARTQCAHHSKGQVMGLSSATARNLFVCLSFLLSLTFLTAPLRPASAQNQKPAAGLSYDEKKRQANDIAVTVVVSGISCTCARFTEDIRNVVHDLGPDGLRVLPGLGVGGLQI